MTQADEISILRQKCQELQAENERLKGASVPGKHPTLRYFKFGHLQGELREIAEPCAMLAHAMVASLPASAELSAGLRHLLEAKDCFVRAALPPEDAQPTADAPKA